MNVQMHIRREGDTSQQRSQTLVFGIVYPLFGLAFLAILDQIYGGHVYKAIKPRVRALLTRMHILSSPDKAQTYALQDEVQQDSANTDRNHAGDARSSTSPSLWGDEPMSILDTHSRIIEGIPSAPPIIPAGRPEPLVPNRLEHPTLSRPSLPRPSSTSSSKRASLASMVVQAATDEDGYTTDATMSTLPPSYRTHRSHPDLPGYPSTPGERPPLPVAAPSFAEHVFAPPSAYVQPGRRRRNHPQPAPRTVGIPYAGVLPTGEPGESEPRADPHGVSGANQSVGEQPQEYPRRSMDGGIRLAGGRLDEV